MNPNLPLITVPYRLTRGYIRTKTKELSFVYSDAVNNRSYLGQCEAAKGQPNCYVVYTKWNPCSNDPPEAFFDDAEFEALTKDIIDRCIECINRGLPIILFPKIAQGRAQLDKRAPRTYKYLMDKLNYLAYPNVKRDYNLIVK